MTTPNLGLEVLANGAANQLLANTTFALLDALVQTPVISRTLTSAPGSPADGALYIMASAWAGVTGSAADKLALYRASAGAWIVITPKEGWKFEVAADETVYRYDGADWLPWSAGGDPGPDESYSTTSGATAAIDYAVARTWGISLTANCTVTLTGAIASSACSLTLIFTQDGTGGRTVTWPGGITWKAGSPPTIGASAGQITVISLLSVDGGTSWLGSV